MKPRTEFCPEMSVHTWKRWPGLVWKDIGSYCETNKQTRSTLIVQLFFLQTNFTYFLI